MTERTRILKNECRRLLRSGEIVKSGRCANCGAVDGLEIHHIVPLSKGGTNTKTNIVTLCWKCHAAAHDKHKSKRNDAGRHRIEKPRDYSDVMSDVVNGMVKSSAAWASLGISRSTFYRWLEEYVKENEIERNGHNFGQGGRRNEKIVY